MALTFRLDVLIWAFAFISIFTISMALYEGNEDYQGVDTFMPELPTEGDVCHLPFGLCDTIGGWFLKQATFFYNMAIAFWNGVIWVFEFEWLSQIPEPINYIVGGVFGFSMFALIFMVVLKIASVIGDWLPF